MLVDVQWSYDEGAKLPSNHVGLLMTWSPMLLKTLRILKSYMALKVLDWKGTSH